MFQKFHRLFNQYKALYMRPQQYSGHEVLKQLGIQAGLPVIVLIERKSSVNGEVSYYLERALQNEVARVAGELRANVVDGGVDAGLSGSLNTALRERHHPGHYIGVAPAALTHLPYQPDNGFLTALGDAHTHFVLVEGEHWGDEIPVMYALVGALADNTPYLRISIKSENGMRENEDNPIEDNGNINRTIQSSARSHNILLQLIYSEVIENPGSEKILREETLSLDEIGFEPEKLANRIKYFLKTSSAHRRS